MVQRDDYVNINYVFNHGDDNKETKNEKVEKTVDKVLENLSSLINFDSFTNKSSLSNCVIKISDSETDITPLFRRYNPDESIELKNTLKNLLDNMKMKDTSVNVLVDYCQPPCIDDEIQLGTSASPTNCINQLQSINLDKSPHMNSQMDNCQTKAASKKRVARTKGSFKKSLYISDSENVDKSISYNSEQAPDYRYVGLVNQAMTCYLNSLLQALYMTPEFRNALYNWEYKKSLEKDSNKSIPFQLQKLFLNLQTSNKNAVETTSLTRSFGWDSNEAWQQHDIQELCRVMFDALEQNFKNTAQADLINRLYQGKINDYVKCLTCNTENFREDAFLDIALPVRPFDNTVAYDSVVEALEAFVKYETLEGNDQYQCEKCNKKSDAHKGLKFTKFPYILTLQLKRFDFDQNAFNRIKLNDKVTFPDVLNLNSFIEPLSNQESPSREEDAGMSIKCDDSCTTDSSTMDEECASCDVPLTNSNHLSNHDQEDDDDDQDEGIDVRNGTSSSSSSTHNHNSGKREEYALAKGPYIYDLFSVMIHSGSASGGHYYAYIKDFRNDKWLCFNDQSVSPITQEDIQRSYGGGTRGGCYSGAYRSSTNAYMLMYRQIDPDRNALPMDSKDFPPHIKDLLEKMKKSEEDRSYHEEMESRERHFKQNIYYRHPSTYNIEQVSVFISKSYTLSEIAEDVYKKAQLDDLVDLEQCRIVHYYLKYDLVDCSYDPSTKFENLFLSKPLYKKELYLEIRGKSENFENFPSNAMITKVYIIDPIERELLEAPKYVRAYYDQSIKEYKQELKKHFNIDSDNIQLLGKEILPKKILEDDYKFESHLSLKYPYKIYAAEVDPMTLQNLTDSPFYKFSEDLDAAKTFFIDPNVVAQEPKERFNLLNFFHGDDKTSGNIYNHRNGISDERTSYGATPLVFDYTSITSKDKYQDSLMRLFTKPSDSRQNALNSDEVFSTSNKVEKWNCQETSNSEDSSLSDSDRTLVGDAPEESENESESALVHIENNKNGGKFFKLFELKRPNLWKVSIDKSMTEEELKKKLEPYLNIPKDFFKIVDLSIDECNSYPMLDKWKDDQKYSICLERVVQPDEVKMDVYFLKMDSPDPLQKLFTAVLKKNIQIVALKQDILAQLKQDSNMDLPYDCVDVSLLDDENCQAVCIQELPDESLLAGRLNVYVRKWDRSEMHLHDPQLINISREDFSRQLIEKVTLLSNIPCENLEFTTLEVKKKYSYYKLDTYPWRAEIKPEEIDSKTYILYRDLKEPERKLSTADDETGGYKRSFQKEQRMSGLMSSSLSSSRKEKGLKIHVDST